MDTWTGDAPTWCTWEVGSARSGPTGVRGLNVLSTEGITNYASLTAFLPNLTGFPSPRGPSAHLFTADAPQRPTKRCPAGLGVCTRSPAGHLADRTSCPVSAASAASAPAAARRTAAAGGVAPAARVTAGVATGVAARVPAAAAGRTAVPAPGPPAAAGRRPAARRPAPPGPGGRLAPSAGPRDRHHEGHDHHHQNHTYEHSLHGPHVLPFPRSEAPRFATIPACRGDAPAVPGPKQT